MQLMQIVWLVVLVALVVAEVATAALVSLWFCAGALVAFLLALVWPDAYALQIIAFVIVSVICLIALRPLARKITGGKSTPTNADANIGKMGQVVSEVQPGRFGRVMLEGLEWTAKSDVVLPVGTWCLVRAIEGVKLVVTPLPAGMQHPTG